MARLNQTQILESVVASQIKAPNELPKFSVGDTIDVHYKIIEGDKERVQVFQGVLLADTGRGIHRMISVRRIVDYAKAGVRQGSNPYIGRLNNSRVRSALKATLDGFLSR